MKWFLVEFWHFVIKSNILGVIFGLMIGAWWKRIGKVDIRHVPDSEVFSEDELLRAEKKDENSFLINVFNQKGVDIFILSFELDQGGRRYKARRRRGEHQSDLDILNVSANSAKTIALLCETVPQIGDVVRVYVHKRRKPIVFKIK